ncbi:MAG: ABC transporter ATP-binding protein [Silicimonas sp.]|jgi:multiple sugar transport system ATP-binding protein|uniref:ABC transporter ATP-binding protein n=1 Tax=Roseitalea porphyridii TaxID=1852022 RepID=UPI0032ED20D6
MIELCDIVRRFGTQTVLHGISLKVAEGSFTSLLGPSGCGKSTTLRIMAGLDRPSAGQVLMNGVDVIEQSAAERNVAMVFQSYALYPHLTVYQNIALPLSMRQMNRLERLPLLGRFLPSVRDKRAKQARQVGGIAEMLGIGALLDRKPSQLSGGQKQRVAVGRALVRDPSLFLLDEPLSNLDAKLRVQMRGELMDLHRRTGRSFVYVTHDQAEAMSMSDDIAVFMDGRIVQFGSPRTLYETPQCRQVADFIGSHAINWIELPATGDPLPPPLEAFRIDGRAAPTESRVLLGLRPEHLLPSRLGRLQGQVEAVEYMGAEVLVTVRTVTGDRLRAIAPGDHALPPQGAAIALNFEPRHAHLFDADTGARINASVREAQAWAS